ncbi:MAG TPA: hypothetical protein VG890_04880 [Puia sp.]|nr:hypothetical protein [Puia sp.]
MKIKATYGYSGNVDPNQTAVAVASTGLTNPLSNFPVLRIGTPNNPSLRWEKVSQLDLGIEFSTKSQLLSGSIDYYQKKGTDLFGPAFYDYTTWGASNQITENIADMRGNGIDAMLKSVNINKSFRWTTNFIFNYNTDKTIKYFSPYLQPIYSLLTPGRNITPVVGYPLYAIAAYKWGGLNAAGDPQGYLDGHLSTDYNAIAAQINKPGSLNSSIIYKGASNPTFFGALINEFNWKGFSASFDISYSLGYYFRKRSFTSGTLINQGSSPSDYSERWQHPGDELKTQVPAFVYTDYPQFSSRDAFYSNAEVNVLNAGNIRLQYVNLNYTLTGNRRELPFDQIQIYLNASNLGILWRANHEHLDPDYPLSPPPPKSFTIGLRATL